MTPAEITKELDELESRLERLRIKYDQYFTGIERALPFVLRKDIDRRFHGLHREPMRNTGLRFRFQTLVQRFTMYQTYWGRIIRQIEEGTWKRDLVRAQRLGLKPVASPSDATQAAPADPEELSADQLEEVDDDTDSRPSTHASRGGQEELPDSLFGAWRPDPSQGREELPESLPAFTPEPVAPVTPVAPPEPTVRPRPVLSPFGALRAPSPARGVEPAVPAPSIQVTPRQSPSPSAGTPAVLRPAPVVPPPPGVVIPPPGTGTGTGAQPAPGSPRTLPARTPRTTTGAQPSAAAPAPSAARPAGGGEDAGMRQLYDRYLEARKQTGESTNVQFETVAKQVRESLPRLAEKYQGADVKLDVTIKDGKAILRPVVTVKKK